MDAEKDDDQQSASEETFPKHLWIFAAAGLFATYALLTAAWSLLVKYGLP